MIDDTAGRRDRDLHPSPAYWKRGGDPSCKVNETVFLISSGHSSFFLSFFFFLGFYLFILEQGEGRGKERERNINV